MLWQIKGIYEKYVEIKTISSGSLTEYKTI